MADDENAPSRGVTQTGEAVRAADRGNDLFRQSHAIHPDEVEAAPHRFGAGRPKDSKNRSSSDISRMIQHIGGHPLLAQARIAAMSIQDIREMLGCTRLEAFDRWLKVMDNLAPYVASKQPLAVAVSGRVTALNFTVPLGDGESLLGPDAVAQLFAAGRQRAVEEGFALPALAAPSEMESDDVSGT